VGVGGRAEHAGTAAWDYADPVLVAELHGLIGTAPRSRAQGACGRCCASLASFRGPYRRARPPAQIASAAPSEAPSIPRSGAKHESS
jgi:hypothetical protein